MAEKTENIVRAMRQAGVPRLVVMSAGGIYDELPEPFNSWDKSVVGHTRQPICELPKSPNNLVCNTPSYAPCG